MNDAGELEATGSETEVTDLVLEGLPERPDPSTWVTETPAEPPPDPNGGRNTETEFMLRNVGF